MKQKALTLFLMLSLVLAATAQTNKKIRSLETKRIELKKKISKSESQLKKTQTNVKTQLNDLNALSSKIDVQRKVVGSIQTEVGTLQQQLTRLEQELDVLKAELADKKKKYKHSMLYLYRNRSTQDKLMFIFSANNFSQMFRRLRYVEDYANYQRVQGEQIQNKEVQVRTKQSELLAAKAEKNRLLDTEKRENIKLENQHKERQGLVNSLQKQQKQLQVMLSKDRKQYGALNAQIDRLIQIEIAAAERRRKAAEAAAAAARQKRIAAERAAQQRAEKEERRRKEALAANNKTSGKSTRHRSRKNRNEKTAYVSSTPKAKPMNEFVAPSADRILSSNFEANRGRLPMPITGSYVVSSHYGQYSVQGLRNVQLDNKGINITGKSGARARAIFNGEVSAVFSFGGYVNILVRHGRYISVYCNLSSASVSRGQQVSTRDILGTVASDGAGNSTLHFQLRKETSKLNPESWLGR
ncbi:MAG: peptidoglycan DD-metalloendopeptidase family protein [Bacteroidaceae bacterium]